MSKKHRSESNEPSTNESVDNVSELITVESVSESIEASVDDAIDAIINEPVVSEEVDAAVLEEAVANAENHEARIAAYAEQEAGAPLVEPEAVAAESSETPPAKKRKGKERKEAPTSKPIMRNAKPSVKIVNALGGEEKARENFILDASWGALEPTALKAAQDEALNAIDSLAVKVRDKAVQFFTSGVKNEVIKRTLTVLAKEGVITSGDKGNVQTDLVGKYSIGTARSQANQMFMLLPNLGITKKVGKGRQVLNPDSMQFARVKGELPVA